MEHIYKGIMKDLLRLCIDYWLLNKVTIKNKYHIPLIGDLFNQFCLTKYSSKLDLRLGYYKVWISESDYSKTTCVNCYNAYEFLVFRGVHPGPTQNLANLVLILGSG